MILLDEGIEISYDKFLTFLIQCVGGVVGGGVGRIGIHYSHATGEKTRAETQTMEVTCPV